MKLEGVMVCVGYLDYLSFTYAVNRRVFDHVIVVTSSRDPQTIAFCQQRGITCVVTEAMYRPGAVFDKGLAINAGFQALRYHDWVLHFDLDIALPGNLRELLPPLHPDLLYGARRIIVEYLHDYYAFVTGQKTAEDFEFPDGSGVGYFQLFNWQSGVIKRCTPGAWYPSAPSGSESDWRFRNMWGVSHGKGITTDCLVELKFPVVHLGAHGTDEHGRAHRSFFKNDARPIRTRSGDLILRSTSYHETHPTR